MLMMSIPRNPDREREEGRGTRFLVRWEGEMNDCFDRLFLDNTGPSNIQNYNLEKKKKTMARFHPQGTHVTVNEN